MDPTTAFTNAIENSTKVANTPLFYTVIDRLLGFRISEWKAQGDVIQKQIRDGYEEAKSKGLATQYVSAFRANTNLINIATKATKYIDSSRSNDITFENDFFWNTIEHAKTISNEEMQELIAKILAGEYNAPGTYSMSTLQTLKMLGKNELELFEKMCSLIINYKQIPKILLASQKFMDDIDIDFNSLQLLQSYGLFFPNSVEGAIENNGIQNIAITYFDKNILFEPVTPDNLSTLVFRVPPFFCLSPVGEQLLQHLNPKPNEKYFDWLKENYQIPNYKIIA
jgi:hypothetical protein